MQGGGVCIRCQEEDFLNQNELGVQLSDGIKKMRVSLWPEANLILLNLDQFIHTCIEGERERERVRHVLPLHALYS